MGFAKWQKSNEASLSEPYSTAWRQPITFKLLRSDWPPPRNRRSSTGNCNDATTSQLRWLRIPFVVNSNFSEAWVNSAGQSNISSIFQHGLQDGYLSLNPHVKGGLFPLSFISTFALLCIKPGDLPKTFWKALCVESLISCFFFLPPTSGQSLNIVLAYGTQAIKGTCAY